MTAGTPPLVPVAARKLLMPFPRALDDFIERLELRLPAELAPNFLRRCNQTGRIARSPRLFHHRDFFSRDLARRVDHFANARTSTCAEIVKFIFFRAEREHVRLRQVENV